MEYITGTTEFKFNNSAVCLGKFDGLHRGHMKLVEKTKEFKKDKCTSIMFTFDYHPMNLFSSKEISLIYTQDEKRKKLEKKGLDILIEYPFTQETAHMLAKDFVKEILINKLGAHVVVVGNDFCFGKGRSGDVSLLKKLSKEMDFKLIICDKIKSGQAEISSTLIRNEIIKGNIEFANEMLGHKYFILGEVLHGMKVGRTLGIPTTNIITPRNKLLPPNGVYVSQTIIDGISYKGITNIGYKPTVGEDIVKGVETYMFNYSGDLYGKTIEVELYCYVRKERKFSDVKELKKQIHKDVEFGKRYLCL